MSLIARLVIGTVAAVLVGAVAKRAGALSASGAFMAAVLGAAAVAAGWSWAIILIIYFVASSALSRLGATRKAGFVAGVTVKEGPRDGWQVVANGLPFLVACIAVVARQDSTPVLLAIGGGSLAASAADTWATEVGTWLGRTPRSILTWRPLRVGESGGVTVAGLSASVAGAGFMAGVAMAAGWPRVVFGPILVGGIAGAVFDSIAGASFQYRAWCDACDQSTEMRIHSCGAATRHHAGVAFIENDAVNFLAGLVGAIVAAVLVNTTPQ